MTTCVKLPGRCKFLKAIPENVSFFHQLFSHEGGSVEPQYKKKRVPKESASLGKTWMYAFSFCLGFCLSFNPNAPEMIYKLQIQKLRKSLWLAFGNHWECELSLLSHTIVCSFQTVYAIFFSFAKKIFRVGIGKRNISLGWPTLLHANHLCDILVKCTGGEFRLQKNRRISSGTCYAKWLCNKPLPQLHRRLHWSRTQGIAVISFDKVQGTGFKAWIASPFSLSPFFFFFFRSVNDSMRIDDNKQS